MFGDIEKMSKGLFADMMKEAQANTMKNQLMKVNFVIEKTLEDGRKLTANSYNPILLDESFREFEKLVKKNDAEERKK